MIVRTIMIIALFPGMVAAQRMGAFSEHSLPYDAESIRLGGMYVGVGRGLASMHSNGAALAFQSGAQLLFSSGRSMHMVDFENAETYSAAAAFHFPDWQSTVGIEFTSDRALWEPEWQMDPYPASFVLADSRFSLHAASRMNGWLALGLAIRHYRSSIEQRYARREQGTGSAVAWDIALSVNGRHALDFLGRPTDEIRYGITFDNILGSEVAYIDESQSDPVHQVFRVGAAYFWRPLFGRALGAEVLSALVTAEASLQGTGLEYRNWGTVGGAAELRILEVLLLSAGVENFVRISSRYSDHPEYPVLRWGAGIDLPLDRLLSTDFPLALQIDYARTDWSTADDEYPRWDPAKHTQQVNAVGAQLKAGIP